MRNFLKSAFFPSLAEKSFTFLIGGSFFSLGFFIFFIFRLFFLLHTEFYYTALGAFVCSGLFLYIFIIYLKEIYGKKYIKNKS